MKNEYILDKKQGEQIAYAYYRLIKKGDQSPTLVAQLLHDLDISEKTVNTKVEADSEHIGNGPDAILAAQIDLISQHIDRVGPINLALIDIYPAKEKKTQPWMLENPGEDKSSIADKIIEELIKIRDSKEPLQIRIKKAQDCLNLYKQTLPAVSFAHDKIRDYPLEQHKAVPAA